MTNTGITKNEVGVSLTFQTVANGGSPATWVCKVKKPSGATTTFSVSDLDVNFTTGVITYATKAGDINEAGEFRVQVTKTVSGVVQTFDVEKFVVGDTLY
jgi:hypothetical protein